LRLLVGVFLLVALALTAARASRADDRAWLAPPALMAPAPAAARAADDDEDAEDDEASLLLPAVPVEPSHCRPLPAADATAAPTMVARSPVATAPAYHCASVAVSAPLPALPKPEPRSGKLR
jgi:hypothetical protein